MRIFSSTATLGVRGTSRVAAFSDGVFSIAITLLVLNFHVPISASDLPFSVLRQWPGLLSYVLSFVIIGIYWVAHHFMFFYIKRVNRPLLWINILFLMCIAFIPFPAALLGQHPLQQASVVIYASTLVVTNLVLSYLWWYATSNSRLVDKDIDLHFVKTVNKRNLTPTVIYLISIGLAFVRVEASLVLFFLFPIYYILPSHVDRHFTAASHNEEESKEDNNHAQQQESTAEEEGKIIT